MRRRKYAGAVKRKGAPSLVCLGLTSLLVIGDALAADSTPARPLLGQRVSDAVFLQTTFCRTYGCRISRTTVTGTGSGDAQALNGRVTDISLNNGLLIQLERSPDTRLVAAYLKSVSTVPTDLQWKGLANVAASFFSLTLQRAVSTQGPEIQQCVRLFQGPYKLDAPLGFWPVQGTKTGACTVFWAGTPTGPKTIYTFIAQLPD